MPFFSVIIPTYNRKDLLRKTLDSVFSQTHPDFETIVVDDGSADGTLEMLDGLAARVRVLRQENRGPGAARNLGIQNAAGDYIAFLDSDDLFFPWTLATYRRAIDQHQRPAFLAGKPFQFTDDSQLAAAADGSLNTLPFADYFVSGDKWRWYGVSSFVIKRSDLLAVGGFADRAVNSEDADLALRLGTSKGFVQITSPPTFAYRDHAGNVTHAALKNYAGISMMIDNECAAKYPGGAERGGERWQILGRHLRSGSRALLRLGYPRHAWNIYRRTLSWNARGGNWRYIAVMPLLILPKMLMKEPEK